MTDVVTTPTTGAAEQAGDSTPARPTTRRPQLSAEEMKRRNEALAAPTKTPEAVNVALALAQRVLPDGGTLCPTCGQLAPVKKFDVRPNGTWIHRGKMGCTGDAVSVLRSAGVTFGDAVRLLTGQQPRIPFHVPDNLEELKERAAKLANTASKYDKEVFNGVLHYGRTHGGVEAAQQFYGTWHISPEAVAESGAVVITNPKQFAKDLLARFGEERLIECGLFVRTARGDMLCLINEKFPVVEPHRHPVSGDPLYMQFRASHEQYQRYLDHKAGKRDYKGSEKIISLKGAPVANQVGTGLPRLENLPPGQVVHIFEGFKDGLAGRTGGLEVYTLPGISIRPPEKVCQLLARHKVYVAFDGDESGARGRDGHIEKNDDGTEKVLQEGLIPYLRRHGVDAETLELFPGMDATDMLVARYASGKATGTPCMCATCVQFRADRPEIPWRTA